jgi:hypothetical protein
MKHLLRTVVTKLRQARRLLLRVELTISALQVAMWLALVAASVGGVLIVFRRITATRPDNSVLSPAAAASGV